MFGLLKKTVSTRLGWIGIVANRSRLVYVTLGHRRESTVWDAWDSGGGMTDAGRASRDAGCWLDKLAARLEAYAEGEVDDFRDVQVDWEGRTVFQRRVLRACRAIPYGQTASYADLAARCGAAGAAQAVGNVMASNRLPLIIPCHRVLPRSGRVGEFSAPGGPATKSRLLQLEAAAAPAPHPRSPRHPPPRGGGIYRSMQNH